MAEETMLRDYQLELYLDIVKRRSCILFLPTGSGKTHIAFWLIKSMAADLKKPVVEGGKRTFFLVNTVQLVTQQAELLTKLGNFNVVRLTGDSGVDSFNGDHWHSLEKEYEVFVMTTQVYLDALNSSFLSLGNANLLILDECHHATGHHPMAEVMRLVNGCPENRRPKVLGLSATLLNANIKKENEREFSRKLLELEATFDGQIITAKNCQEIRRSFAAKPKEDILNLPKFDVKENTMKTMGKLRDEGLKVLSAVILKDNTALDPDEENEIQLHRPGLNRSKLLKNVLKDIVVHVDCYGLYMGYTCCQCYIVQLYRYMFASCEPRYIHMMLYITNLAQMMRKVLYTSIVEGTKCGVDNFQSWTTIVRSSSKKIDHLFARLLRLTTDDRCIIFVERKMTAKSLYRIIKLFVAQQKNCEIAVDFIVGSDSNPLRNTREGINDKCKHKEILGNFRNGITNVLVATDVVEEGIDIQECNLVIMFDRVRTFRSYIQSRGRARMKESEYVMLNDLAVSVDAQIQDFRNIDRQLDCIIDQKDIFCEGNDDMSTTETAFDEYVTEIGARVTTVSAVNKIYQYCSILPRDLFTVLLPYWFYNQQKGTCKLRLPANAGTRLEIRGPARSNRKEAKQAAALEGVKLLHRLNLLDDRLLPIRIPEELLDTDYWFPNWDVQDAEEQKSIKLKENVVVDRTFTWPMRTPEFLKNCRPLPDTECYLHIIKMRTMYEEPTILRQKHCHELMGFHEYPFGILTRERLPPICEFPVYSDLGEVRITIEVNERVLVFTAEELDAISKFNRTLFMHILRVVPGCFVFNAEEDSNAYYLVPLIIRGTEAKLVWKHIRKEFELDVKRLSEEELTNPKYGSENYLDLVITPWYNPMMRYIVCDIPCKFLHSDFNERYATYAEYFVKKYNLTPLRSDLPLIHVRPITNNFDGIIPRPIPVSEKKRRRKRENETYFHPELCHAFSFPAVYWYKATLLPSILHRVHYLLMAEDLRRKIVKEAGLGCLELPPSDEDTVPCFKVPTKREVKSVDAASSVAEKDVAPRVHKDVGQRREKVNDDSRIKDIDRVFDLTLEDIRRYTDYVEKPLVSLSEAANESRDEGSVLLDKVLGTRPEKYFIKFVQSPVLMTLKEYQIAYGPRPHQILEGLTLRSADDVLHLERLETLGDSVLKYLVSTSTFIECSELNEGHLTCLKGKLVSNQNLYYSGKKLDIPSYVKAVVFSARNLWCPPGFSLCRTLEQRITDVPISTLLAAEIPHQEQITGDISEETIEKMLNADMEEFVKKKKMNAEYVERRIRFYFGKQELRRKNISDVLEALLGVYLQTCGLDGAFQLLKYYGIPSKAANLRELYSQIPSPPNSSDVSDSIENLLPDYKNIEQLLNYEFRNRYYLLQAFTHASYSGNYVTGCYQKLEFIGDAVLDFLITSYIFEYCDNLSPGQLTDLRSSLVNNNTFGALVVRLQLHRHLLYHSQRLAEAVHSFVDYQEGKNYEIHGNELVRLISEDDTTVAEEVDVPKALGDIFESLAGAIFLDSGCDLLVVWNVYYNIMKHEIDKFSERIPINPVRALYEKAESTRISFCTLPSKLAPDGMEQMKEKIKVSLKVMTNKQTKEYIGRGDTKKTAKRAAAKFALRDLNYNEFLI